MKKLVPILLSLIIFKTAHSQTFKVIKIQGKKAIVEMNDPKLVTLNETYSVGNGNAESTSVTKKGKGGGRDNAIAFDFSLSSQTSPSVTFASLGGTYLWNFKKYEVGPVLGISSTSGSGTSTNTTTIGATGSYNFNENKPGVETILSAIGIIGVVSGSGLSLTTVSAGGNYRWFLLSDDHCITASALVTNVSGSGISTTSFGLQAGIATYF